MKYSLVSLAVRENAKKNKQNSNIKNKYTIPKKNTDLVIKILNKLQDSDLILFSGFTLRKKADLDKVIKSINRKNTFVLEVGKGHKSNSESEYGFYVVQNKKIIKTAIKQLFTCSNNAKKNILNDYLTKLEGERRFNVKGRSVCLIICGEQNFLVSKEVDKRKGTKYTNKYENILRHLDNDKFSVNKFNTIKQGTNIFLNPGHMPMGNSNKVKSKLLYFSKQSRTCLFTVNQVYKKNKVANFKKAISLQYIFSDGKKKEGVEEINTEYKITTIEF